MLISVALFGVIGFYVALGFYWRRAGNLFTACASWFQGLLIFSAVIAHLANWTPFGIGLGIAVGSIGTSFLVVFYAKHRPRRS